MHNNNGSTISIEIIQPCDNEKWMADSLHVIAWKCPSEVCVEFSMNDGLVWQPLGSKNNEDSFFSDPRIKLPAHFNRLLWKVPSKPAKICLIRFVLKENPSAETVTRRITITESCEKKYEWENILQNAPFAPRDGAGAVVFNGKMWLFGGWNPLDQVNFPGDCNSEVWNSADGYNWKIVSSSAPWEKRHTAGWVVHRDMIWLIGGDPIQGHYQNDVWNTQDGLKWSRVASNPPWSDRILHYTVVHNGRMWVIGGQKVDTIVKSHIRWDKPAEDVFYNDVWSSEDGITWRLETENAPWEPRGKIGGGAVKDGFIWLLGGGTYYRQYFPEVWRSADGRNWEKVLAYTPWYPRYYHDVAVFDDRLWVLGGVSRPTGNRNDVWYSTDGLNWYECLDVPLPPRHAASVFVFKNSLWVAAGNDNGNLCRNDVWRTIPY